MCIFDEAACARTYELFMPAVAMWSITRLVLIGDDREFPLVTCTPEGQRAWEQTLFEKLAKRGYPQVMLRSHHRAHSLLMAAPSKVFYDSQLIAM